MRIEAKDIQYGHTGKSALKNEEIPPDKNEETEESEQSTEKSEMESAAITGGVTVKNSGVAIHALSIIGQIEGHYALAAGSKSTKYEHIIPLLVAIEENPQIDALLLILNTVGGDVEAGLAISEMIASMKKPTVSLVIGGGHSIGVPLALSAKKSYIVPSATMTVHPVRYNGLVIGVEQSFEYFTRMQDRIINFIVEHSSVSEENLRKMLFRTGELATDVGSLLDGHEAVACGLIGSVGGLSDVLDELRNMIKGQRSDI